MHARSLVRPPLPVCQQQLPRLGAASRGVAAPRCDRSPPCMPPAPPSLAGLVLGKGTALVRAQLEAAAAAAAAAGSSSGAASAELQLPGGEGSALDLAAAWAGVRALLAPLQAPLGKLLEEVRAVVEANQARRKPKVAKGARDFMPDQVGRRGRHSMPSGSAPLRPSPRCSGATARWPSTRPCLSCGRR